MLPVLQPNTIFFFVSKSTADNMQPVSSSAVAQKISTIGQVEVLYSGSTFDNTSKALSKSVRNYRFICVGLVTNIEYSYIIIPVALLTNNTNYAQTLMANETQQVTLPFAYQSTAIVNFPSDTTVKCKSLYNNGNWILKMHTVWGIL